jgi:hypothetical protein
MERDALKTIRKASLKTARGYAVMRNPLTFLAGLTRLELATSDVTGRRSNQLNYSPARRNDDEPAVTMAHPDGHLLLFAGRSRRYCVVVTR